MIGGNVLDFGLQTTPQLHHLVRMVRDSLMGREEGEWRDRQLMGGVAVICSGTMSSTTRATGPPRWATTTC